MNLTAMLYCNITMNNHVITIVKTCNLERHRAISVARFLTKSATVPVLPVLLSRLDYRTTFISSLHFLFEINSELCMSGNPAYTRMVHHHDRHPSLGCHNLDLISSILVMWLRCQFLDTTIDGSNPGGICLCL